MSTNRRRPHRPVNNRRALIESAVFVAAIAAMLRLLSGDYDATVVFVVLAVVCLSGAAVIEIVVALGRTGRDRE